MSRISVPNAANARLMKTQPIRPFRRGSGGGGTPPPPPLFVGFAMGEVPEVVEAGSHADVEMTLDGVRWNKTITAAEDMPRGTFFGWILLKVTQKLMTEGRLVSSEIAGLSLLLEIGNVQTLTDPDFNFTGP